MTISARANFVDVATGLAVRVCAAFFWGAETIDVGIISGFADTTSGRALFVGVSGLTCAVLAAFVGHT